MSLLLWSLLNVAVLLGVLYLFGRAALLLNKYVGLGAALFFSLALLAVGCGKSGTVASSLPTQNLLGALPPGTPLGNSSSLQTIELGVSFNKIQLLAEYWDERGVLKPRGLYATVAGLTLGHRWQPIQGILMPKGSQLRYTAILRHEWTLLGQPIFSSVDGYTGLMPARKDPV